MATKPRTFVDAFRVLTLFIILPKFTTEAYGSVIGKESQENRGGE
jgi:hypothetical protein